MNHSLEKVKVVMSVFNGEKYIEEQIDSILNQTYPDIELYIRDNCSTDRTIEILGKYACNSKIHVIQGDKNIGYTQGFFTLLGLCGDADYYAYCDCDDVWPKEKIEIAVERLRREDSEIPVLFCSSYDIYDENLIFVCDGPRKLNTSFSCCLLECFSLGGTYVFNQKARELLAVNIPTANIGHDWWTCMVCQGLGKVVFDSRPLHKYRRHSQTATRTAQSSIKLIPWRVKTFLVEGKIKQIQGQLQDYSYLYAEQLHAEDKNVLKLFTNRTVGTALRKMFYPKRFRQKLFDEFLVRCCFVFGIL